MAQRNAKAGRHQTAPRGAFGAKGEEEEERNSQLTWPAPSLSKVGPAAAEARNYRSLLLLLLLLLGSMSHSEFSPTTTTTTKGSITCTSPPLRHHTDMLCSAIITYIPLGCESAPIKTLHTHSTQKRREDNNTPYLSSLKL